MMDYDECIRKGLLVKINPDKELARKELQEAEFDLATAQHLFEEENWKVTIIESYYAMFHMAKHILYQLGIKEKSHYCISKALVELLVKKGLLEARFVDDYDEVRYLRESADYRYAYSEEDAEHALNTAKNFINKLRNQ